MTTFLTVKKGEELKQIQTLLDSNLKAVTDSDGNVRFIEPANDTGGAIMTVNDVAALLQTTVAAVRQMTKARAQRGPHPLPFVKINGKALRFRREEIERWIETTPKRRPAPKRKK